MYNLPEKNPHLSNQRLDGGKVNVRSFKISKRDSTGGVEELMKGQFLGAADRVYKPSVAVVNVEEGILEKSSKFTQGGRAFSVQKG